jgi:hypothetical protein
MPNPADVAALAEARAGARVVDAKRRGIETQLRVSQRRLDDLVASGGQSALIDALLRRIDVLSADLDRTTERLNEALARVQELGDRVAAQEQSEAPIAGLDGQIPMALLPVRIETRYADGGATLHVRLFPDQVHVDAHELQLTEDEAGAGRAYWERRWAAPDDSDEARAAWTAIASGRRPTRARWIVEVTTPANPLGAPQGPQHPTVARRAATWTRPARAAALPTRWVAIGRRGDLDLFRVWSGPVTSGLEVAPGPDDEPGRVLGTEGLRWLSDPKAARQDGVLLTVSDADLFGRGQLRDGLDELVVLGVDSTLSPDDGADELARLLAAHVYGVGLSFVPQGTPTNNTADAASGHTTARAPLADALDPAGAAASDPIWSAGPRLAAALGLSEAAGAPLRSAPGTATAEHAVASALLDATWEATAGTYLGQLLRPVGRIRPAISDADIDQLRVWASAHLFASGPLPLIRVGRQPYGVLPIVDPARYQARSGDRAGQLVQTMTAKLRRWWARGAQAVPRLDGSPDLDTALVALLQRAPVAATARFRRVFPPGVIANLAGFDDLAHQQQLHGWLVEAAFHGRFAPERLRIGTLTTDPRSHPLRIPWARPAGLDQGAALPYCRELRDLVSAPDGRERLATRADTTSLAEALLALSAALELDAAHGKVVKDFASAQGSTSPLVDAVRVRHPDTIGIGVEEAAADGELSFASPKVLAGARIPGLTGTGTVADLVRGQLGGTGAAPAVDGVRRLIAALDRLGDEPGERVEWALRGLLDLYAYRFDAWCTALATQRLADLRQARPVGVHVGCYGWVEGVRPDPPGRDSLGYVHTPSVTHAVAAAVLRSGHAAHRSAAQQALAVDLSARRVRDAMAVLDGVESGQPLGALLGYRIERLLRKRDAVLTRYVLPLRRMAPLRHTDTDLTEPVESIAARDVVDGVALLERWRAPGGRETVLTDAGVSPQHRTAVSAALDTADDVFDAVGDVLLSESVYQTVAGNQERASAALAALDRQQRPVRPEVVQAPRSGTTVTHRVLVLLKDETAPDWEALIDPRGAAEPRLNAWAARLLGPPGSIVFAAEVRRGEAVHATVSATATELGLSPLGVALAARRAAADAPSELESRLARVLAAKVADASEDDRLVLLPDPPAGSVPGTWGLESVRTAAGWVERLGGRPVASGQDLQPLLHDQPAGYDPAELAVRANQAVAALTDAITALDAAAGAPAPAARAALEQAARLGVPDALPRMLAAAAEEQVVRVLATLRAAHERLAAEEASFAERADPTVDQAVEHHLLRLRIVLGDGFPVLPLFRVVEPTGLASSLADRSALLEGDDLAPLTWLHRVALVRPAVEPLSALLTAAEANDRNLNLPHLDVLQLPHGPGQRWVALPRPKGGETPGGAVGIVVHAPDGIDPAGAAAGLVVDEWTEIIPASAETTALSFHYDAPAAHPPQAILLAVPGAPETARWSFDELLGAVREAVALTHLRAVGPPELPDLGGYLPALYVPQDVTGDVPAIDLFDLARRAQRPDALPGVLGKG